MNIALYSKVVNENNLKTIFHLFRKLQSKKINTLVHSDFLKLLKEHSDLQDFELKEFGSCKELGSNVDFLISIGGDGTFLDTISLVRDSGIPVLGINTGRLGFLSNTPNSEIGETIEALYSNNFSIEKRSLLQLDHSKSLFGDDNFALNEVSLLKKDTSSMIIVHVELDGTHLNSYWTDGLIISTATGSTAYSLSCGGPILMPGSGNFVITPIAPHNLNVRPIVIGDNSVLKLRIEGRSESNLIALDSRSQEIKNNEEVTLRKAKHKISIVQLNNHGFIQSLRNKLNWGLDKRNQ